MKMVNCQAHVYKGFFNFKITYIALKYDLTC